jgi:outer membrane protein assembly factor BamB
MTGNCSTRDGRARVGAPVAPHVTWTTQLPTDTTGLLGPSALATDAAGHAYVVTTGEIGESTAALRKVRAADGAILWSDPISPDEETTTPIVLGSGGIDLFGYDAQTTDALFTFDPSTGISTSTDFGVSLYYAPPDLAVGADGSLYVTHSDDVGGAHTTTYVSRVAPGGAVLWTTVDLGTLGPPPMVEGEIDPSVLALGEGDLVIVAVDVLAKDGDYVVVDAFDPATGAVRWSTTLPGGRVGGPVVRPDGSVTVLLYTPGAMTPNADLVILDPASGVAVTHPLGMGVVEIFGVMRDGTVLAGADAGNGITGILAFGSDGTPLWAAPGDLATIAADGTVLAVAQGIVALDGATGETKWTLPLPSAEGCIVDFALTSDAGLVGLQCDGTLFGASD